MKIATEPVTIGNGVGSNRCEKDEEGLINNIPPSPSLPNLLILSSISSNWVCFLLFYLFYCSFSLIITKYYILAQILSFSKKIQFIFSL